MKYTANISCGSTEWNNEEAHIQESSSIDKWLTENFHFEIHQKVSAK